MDMRSCDESRFFPKQNNDLVHLTFVRWPNFHKGHIPLDQPKSKVYRAKN